MSCTDRGTAPGPAQLVPIIPPPMSLQVKGRAAGGRGGGCAGAGAGPDAAAAVLGAPSAGACPTRVDGAATAGRQLGDPALQPPPAPAPAPPSGVPGTAVAPCAGLAALSVQLPAPGSAAASGAGPSAPADGGGAPAAGPSPLPTPGSDTAAATTDAGPPELLDDDGVPLSAEAAASPFSPPATERLAAFLKLVDHGTKAGLQNRHMRNADFSDLAATAGVPLFGDESIIVADLQSHQARGLANQSAEEVKRGRVGYEDAAALHRRAWAVLLAQTLPVLQRRMDKGTLLPGTLRKVEEAYFVYEQQSLCGFREEPVPSADLLRMHAPAFGYEAAMHASVTVLALLPLHSWRSEQREKAQAFVLSALRLMSKTATLRFCLPSENDMVNRIERTMTPTNYGADFCASVLAVWRSPAVADSLRARGVLQGGIAAKAAADAGFDARQKADVAKKGLRACALPSCGKEETTVLQFRVCGHCRRGLRYCCPEHAKQHWKAHKRETEEGEATEEQGGEAAGSGGGAAA